MRTISTVTALAAGLFAACLCAAPKDQAPKLNLERQLESQFVITKASADKSTIVHPGSVLIVQKDDLKAGPFNTLTYYLNVYKDGRLKHSAANALLQDKAQVKTFAVGEAFFLVRIEAKDNGIIFYLLSCAAFDGMLYKAAVMFPLPKGYLSAPDFPQIHQAVNQVFTVSGANDTAPPQPQQAAQPATIAIGQTTAQVAGALGPPEKMVKLCDKEIYVYKDLKVTFMNGKVSDVQ